MFKDFCCSKAMQAWLLAAVWPFWLSVATGADKPIISVDPGAHSAPALGIRFFRQGERIVTTSLDKTVRIWRGRDFKLLRTLRIPIDFGLEGRLYFADASPDGRRVVAGGHTCVEWEQQSCLYVFDGETGEFLQRITGFKGVISFLRFSPDGKVLAVGQTESGIVFLNAQNFSRIGQDSEYGSAVSSVDISQNNYAAASGLDGYLRIYDAALRLVARQKLPDLGVVGSTFFSPDGKKLLLGSFSSPRFEILSFPELTRTGFVDLQKFKAGQQSLRNAVWSSSGNYIFAAGDDQDLHQATIYRWDARQLVSNPQLLTLPAHRIEGLRPFIDDQMLFSTVDGFVGIADHQGHIRASSEAAFMQFPLHSESFQVSEDGAVVAFPTSQDESEVLVFDTRDLNLQNHRETSVKLHSARTKSKKLQLLDWKSSNKPLLNTRLLAMQNMFELVRCFSFTPKDRAVVFGTDFSLKAYDANAALLWKNTLTNGAAWNVTVTPNGKLAVAALSDGTVRWYRMTDGIEILALFVHAKTHEWVLWRPDGYYASSENGDNLIGWHINRGKDSEPDFYRAVQFERQFYRPDLLRAQLGPTTGNMNGTLASLSESEASNVATRRAGRGGVHDRGNATPQSVGELTLSQLIRIAPPRIKITSARTTTNSDGVQELELTVDAEKNSLPMQDINVYANLLPIIAHQERQLATTESNKFSRTFRFPISSDDNLIRVEINNGVSLGLTEQWIESSNVKQTDIPKGDLYVLAVGANRFSRISSTDKSKVPDLNYAVNDAVQLADLLRKAAAGSGFKQAHVRLLADSSEQQPTRQNILEALRFFEQAGPNDTVLLFLASHGFSDETGNYFFLPQDGDYADIESILSGRNLTGKAPSLLSWTDFFDSIRRAAGRRVMIVDTCQAKNIFGEFDSRSLRKRSAAALFPLLLASKGDEFSQEYEPGKHGLFTHALIEGMRGNADANHDRKLTVTELYEFAVPLVNKLHEPLAGTQTPQLIAPGTLANIELPLAESR